jgi:Protein of unknown function (DUF2442)
MKLLKFEHEHDYEFALHFANGAALRADLKPLIGSHVPSAMLSTARIDPEWGCLEFAGGKVDIEPQTLYRYANKAQHRAEFDVLLAAVPAVEPESFDRLN